MINNLLASYFTPSQTATIIVVAVVGVLLIVLNIVLAYVFNKRGERKLYDLLLQQQRELLMKQLEEMRSGEITFEDPDAEQLTMQDFFVRSAPEKASAETVAEEQVITEEPIRESEKVEEIEESEEIEEIPPEELIDEESEPVEEFVINGLVVRYNRSFTARLTQASDEMKSRYSEIKNYILSYKGVKNRISWKRETFRIGRNTFACFVMRGKTLCLCLATDPARFEETKYKIFDLSVRSPKNKMPSMYRILNDRRVKYAKEIIDMLMAELGLNRNEAYADEDFMLSYRTTEELIDCDLIKIIGQNTTVSQEVAAVRDVVTEAEPEAIEEPVETVEAEPEVNEEPVGTAEAEPEAIEEPVETAEAEPEVNEEPVEEVEEDEGISVQDASDKMSDEEAKASVEVEIITKPVRKGGKSAIVNIQSLSKNYSAGDVVNLESLREKNLIAKNVVYVKILAKGSLNKALTVEADDFSLEAVKMIVLTGGRAIRTKNGC